MANIVAQDGCEKTFSRWNIEKTRLLSDGCDKGSSLEISLTLSLTSSRMMPEAQELLSLLSILPDGLSQAELVQSKLPIPNVLACKSTLIKTSLAYLDNGKRLRVLTPIREYIGGVYPPSPALKSPLRQYYHEILGLWHTLLEIPHDRGIAARLIENFNNLQAVLSDALSGGCADFRQTLNSVLTLDQIAAYLNRRGQPLMGSFDPYLPQWGADPVYGRYLMWQVGSVRPGQNPQVETDIARGHIYFEHATPQIKGKWYIALGRYYSGQPTGNGLFWFQQALSAASACETPPLFMATALSRSAEWMDENGQHAAAMIYAQDARKHAQSLGSLFKEAHALKAEAGCCRSLGDLENAIRLLTMAEEPLVACGLYGSLTHSLVENHRAEVFLLKTEYIEARRLNARTVETAEGSNCGDGEGHCRAHRYSDGRGCRLNPHGA
ncbi:hypothetical protein FB451DRAFT_293536 [Mycena latifolia]|nr:hypothetical protein FB451DRAFT_293536 [Mycena latifolia]